MSLIQIFSVEDCLYYANSMNTVKSKFISDTSVSGRTIYVSPFTFDEDCVLTCKFKSTPPNNWLVGFGSDGTTFNLKGLIFKVQGYNSSKTSIMWADSSNVGRDASLNNTVTANTVLKITTTDLNRLNWYIDDSIVAYRDTYTGVPLGVRFDVFNNNDYDIDYIKVKPL